MSGSQHTTNSRSRWRRAAIGFAVVLVHGLGLYLIVHHSVRLIRLETDRAAGASVQVRLVAAPTPQPAAKPEPKPEPKPERPPEPKPKPAEKPVVRKTAPLLSTEAPAARSVAPARTEPVKPVEPAPQPPVPTPSAPPAPAATPPALAPAPAAGPKLLDTPKQISSAEFKQLGCRIPRPEYPPKARRLEQEGTVVVSLTIGADGAVKAARVARSSGYPLLDSAALASIEAGRCQPYTTAGIPRAVEAEQPIAFNLND